MVVVDVVVVDVVVVVVVVDVVVGIVVVVVVVVVVVLDVVVAPCTVVEVVVDVLVVESATSMLDCWLACCVSVPLVKVTATCAQCSPTVWGAAFAEVDPLPIVPVIGCSAPHRPKLQTALEVVHPLGVVSEAANVIVLPTAAMPEELIEPSDGDALGTTSIVVAVVRPHIVNVMVEVPP